MLERQVKKVFGSLDDVPQEALPLLDLVSSAYDHADEDRHMTEHSLELNSREFELLNEKMQAESDRMKANLDEINKMNNLMVNRELKMIELKHEVEMLREMTNHQS